MGRRALQLVLGVVLVALGSPASAGADHVTVSPSISATVISMDERSAHIKVPWSISCHGNGTARSYHGDKWLRDTDTGEEIYLGGISGAGGEAGQIVSRREKDRRLTTHIKAQCSKTGPNNTVHGSEWVETVGGMVVIPGTGGGRGGSGGGGSGGGHGGGGDPDEPLGSGGCAIKLRGTPGADRLTGGAGGDLIFALGGSDRVRGKAGHDCLIGGPGADRLWGGRGNDRLTGGAGADWLKGGPGRNVYDAGPGNDRIKARNGTRDEIDCGAGDDSVRADASDRLRRCEHVSR